MAYKEIQIQKNDEGVVVDFWPGMFVKPKFQKEPTKNNPEIKADVGMVGGKLSPLKVYYPEEYDVEDVLEYADSVNNDNSLFNKINDCPMCERKRREIIARLRNALHQEGSKEERIKRFMDEGQKIKSELKEEGIVQEDPVEDPDDDDEMGESESGVDAVPETMQPPVFGSVGLSSTAYDRPVDGVVDGLAPSNSKPTEDIIMNTIDPMELSNNMTAAVSSFQRTLLILMTVPERIVIPSMSEENYK